MARSDPVPSLEEYVAARGPELLRTAWLLTGDEDRASALVEESLATLWRRPSRPPHWGDGSLDAAARRAVVRTFVRRRLRDRRHPPPTGSSPARSTAAPRGGDDEWSDGWQEERREEWREDWRDDWGTAPAATWADDSRDAPARLRDEVLMGLDRLTRLQRAVVVLRCDDGLADEEVADLVGRGTRTVRTERARALVALSHIPALAAYPRRDDGADREVADSWGQGGVDEGLEDDLDQDDDVAQRLGDLFDDIVPPGLASGRGSGDGSASQDLVTGTRRYAVRARRRRALAVVEVAVVVVVVGSLATVAVQHDRSEALAQRPPALTCAGLTADRGTPQVVARPLSTRARAVLVCADRSDQSIWPGSLPPDEPVTDSRGLDYLVLAPPVNKDSFCPRLPVGPAFTITVQGKDGRSTTYDNVDLACNGWPALDHYLIALGEQQAVESFDPRVDPFPPCPTILGQKRQPHSGAPGVPQGTRFIAGSACLHQSPEPNEVPVFRRPKRSVLGAEQLRALTAEAATHGSGPRSLRCDDSDPSGPVVVVRAVTADGQLVELTGSGDCGLVLLVNWSPGDYWTLSRATADAVAADFGGFPR